MSTKTATVTNIRRDAPKGDDAQANTAGAAERASVLDKIDTAEDLLGTALIEGLRMTIMYGPTSTAEVTRHYTRCGSPAVYSSWFNLGDKAQKIVGQKLALKAVTDACAKGNGSMFQRAREALSGIVSRAKTSGVKELGPQLAAVAVKESVAEAKAKSETRGTAKKSATRGVKTQDTATMASAALECGKGHREMAAFLLLSSQNAQRLPVLPGRETACREALDALAAASEAWQVFAR